jgi:hypothetical protein
MAGVQIFRVELVDRASGAHLTLAGGRDFASGFYLELADLVLHLDPDQASRFAMAARRLIRRQRKSRAEAGTRLVPRSRW